MANDRLEDDRAADGTRRLASREHCIWIARLGRGCLLITVQGNEVEATRNALMHVLQSTMADEAPLTLYIDMRQVGRVTADGREAWAKFGKENRPKLGRVVMLVQSRLVDMAMSLLAMFIGGGLIHTTSDEAQFVRAVQSDVPAFAGLPKRVARYAA